MTPARNFAVEDHGIPITAEQALKILKGPIGTYHFFSFSRTNTSWGKRLKSRCLQVAWDNLLNIHADLGIQRLHLSVRNPRAQYPTVELVTTSKHWWDQPYEFLKEYGRSHGHGERDVGIGTPIYSRTVDYTYFSEIQEGEWDTLSKQRIGEPIRYLTRHDPW